MENEAGTKTCPKCAETVLSAAEVCKHCGYRFAGRPWLVPLVLVVVAILAVGFMWNQNRLDEERQNNNVCSLTGTC